jgi:hypothetical protein
LGHDIRRLPGFVGGICDNDKLFRDGDVGTGQSTCGVDIPADRDGRNGFDDD